jgi:PIN domain nuclease of toxin-antitoxin system
MNNSHAGMAGEFRLVHKDPFDRVLAAQAIIEGFGLVTDDRAMEALGAEMVWRG